MRITKAQLQQIIQEELNGVLAEESMLGKLHRLGGKPFGQKYAQLPMIDPETLEVSDRPKIYEPERWAVGIPNWLARGERLAGRFKENYRAAPWPWEIPGELSKLSGEEEEASPELKGPAGKSRRRKNKEFREKFELETGRPPKRMDYPQHGKKA